MAPTPYHRARAAAAMIAMAAIVDRRGSSLLVGGRASLLGPSPGLPALPLVGLVAAWGTVLAVIALLALRHMCTEKGRDGE